MFFLIVLSGLTSTFCAQNVCGTFPESGKDVFYNVKLIVVYCATKGNNSKNAQEHV